MLVVVLVVVLVLEKFRFHNQNSATSLSIRGRKNHPLVPFRIAGSAYKLDEMKAARNTTYKLSRLLEAALDTALVIVIGYALILLSQSQGLF